jgi:hypothetical protein
MPSPHLQEKSSRTQSNANIKTEVASENVFQQYTCYCENVMDIELPTNQSQESGGVSHPEGNHSLLLNYHNHSCDPVIIKDDKKLPFMDKIGL